MTSTYTLTSWQTTTATLLTQQLPLQSFDTAIVLVQAYLAANGGWVPDVPTDPTGFGMPATGETPTQATISIVSQQYQRMYALSLTVNLTVNIAAMINMTPGLSPEAAIAAATTIIQNLLQDQLMTTKAAFVQLGTITGSSENSGLTTQQDRISIAAILTGQLTDPRAVALEAAISTFGLNSTYNVVQFYTDGSNSLVVFIQKYLDTTYAALDTSSQIQYIMLVDQTTYDIQNGMALPLTSN